MINDHHNDHQMKNIQIEYGHITKSILIVIISMKTREISRTNLRSASIKEIFFFVNCSTLSKDAGIPPAPNFIRIFRIYICICICNCSTLSKHTGIPPLAYSSTNFSIFVISTAPLSLYECESNIWESVPTEKLPFVALEKLSIAITLPKSSVYLLLFQFWFVLCACECVSWILSLRAKTMWMCQFTKLSSCGQYHCGPNDKRTILSGQKALM